MRRVFWGAAWLPLLCGCVMFEVGVTNPVVGLTTVAVVPFFNLSQERAVDGRRFALAYYTELQKTPGFQVIPLGVVEQTMFDHQLQMNNPGDVLKLCQLLNADAVAVGAVTDYEPYYPPRIGLQVSWYSPRPWQFYPGIPGDEAARELVKPPPRFSLFKKKPKGHPCPPGMYESCPPETPITVSRGQSPDDELPGDARPVSLPEFLLYGEEGAPRRLVAPQSGELEEVPPEFGGPKVFPSRPPHVSENAEEIPGFTKTLGPVAGLPMNAMPFDPTQPLMSYTRMFDGADAKLTARLRDFVELSGDLRAGGWEAHLIRSEDFIRFTAHVMIVEMLQLHGGEARKRVVFKMRKYR